MTSCTHSSATVDSFDLSRFLEAQVDSYTQALNELRSGQKQSHWMWFIFPQFAGLGTSAVSQRYAIKTLAEAQAYLQHPILGERIVQCTKIVNGLEGHSVRQIFGTPDDMKFHSSMTLFELASGPNSEFAEALDKYFAGHRDTKSQELVRLASEGCSA
jgi:uncharacterized protein (DUF1810 family)